MLATLFLGTSGIDTASVEYAGENLVDVRINDTLHENVDSSGGIRINLGSAVDPTQATLGDLIAPRVADKITIDHRITDSLFLHNANEIIVDGGDNVVHAFTPRATIEFNVGGQLLIPLVRHQAGTINDNVVFTSTERIQTGDGQDTFNLSTSSGRLAVNSGDGDDLFRFGTGEAHSIETIDGVFIQLGTITANGDDGNDRFVYLPGLRSDVQANGGDGADVADHRYSRSSVSAYFFGGEKAGPFYEQSPWQEIETFMGAAGQENLIELRTQSTGTRFDWTVDGDITTIRNTINGATVEVHNFNQFRSGSKSLDWFHVKETARDIRIIDADQMRISSDFDLINGDLRGINHDISVVRQGSYIMALPPNVNTFVPPVSEDTDGVTSNPDVFISGMGGEGIIATLEADQTIQLRDGGSIQFVDEQPLPERNVIILQGGPLGPFEPSVELHGSGAEDDIFLVKETWTPTTIYAHDDDDTFFIGSTNRNANGNIARIRNELTIGAGRGADQLYFNNQAFTGPARYNLSGNSLGMLALLTTSGANGSDETVSISLSETINFNSAVEVIRVNGSPSRASDFRVTSNTSATMIVTGGDDADNEDQLGIYFEGASDPLPRIRYLRDDPKSGSATANQAPFGSVHFRGIEQANPLNVTTF